MSAVETQRSSAPRTPRVGVLGVPEQAIEQLTRVLDDDTLEWCFLSSVEDFLAGPVTQQTEYDVLLLHLPGLDDAEQAALETLIESAQQPLVYDEALLQERPRAWMRRLKAKLLRLARGTVPDAVELPAETTVWVLGASFGGPAAVKRFLCSMPVVPNAAFFLAQHIGDGFIDLLAAQLDRATDFVVRPATQGCRVAPGHIYVAPLEQLVTLDQTGIMHLQPDPEERLYQPSIDALMTEVARVYGACAGAVIFSGMGEDGSHGAQTIAAAGGEVWAQNAASCTISSMPDEAVETGAVSRRGTPEELSQALAQYLAARERVTRREQGV